MAQPSANSMSQEHSSTLRSLPGLGPKRLTQLHAAHIFDAADLLHIAPSLINDESSDWHAGDRVQCQAQVLKVTLQFIRRRGNMLTLQLRSRNDRLFKARFFNAAYLKKRFSEGDWYRFQGSLDKKRGDTLIMPSFQALDAQNDDETAQRIYPNKPDGISNKQLNEWIDHLLANNISIRDPLQILTDDDYTALIQTLHNTEVEQETWEHAHKELSLREQCSFLWRMKSRKIQRATRSSPALPAPTDAIQMCEQQLGFTLSDSQVHATQELFSLIEQAQPSHSLLQGDVGCGKSAVSLIISWVTLQNKHKVIYLAPTRLLAQQQFQLFQSFFADTHYRIQFISNQQQTNELVADIYIGTHALFQAEQVYSDIGIIFIDEQQKFGVEQRQNMIAAASAHHQEPHVCMMSATPIPRSLEQSFYGDLDIVNIDKRPTAHAQITTEMIKQPRINHFATYCRDALERGEHCIFICAYLEAEDKNVLHAQKLYQQLQKDYSASQTVLLHGGMSDDEQLTLYQELQNGHGKIIVATSVIEVGFNLPHATFMMICNSERFGLSQLHQMRGRLGRGQLPGTCYIASPKPDEHPRLQFLATHNDGFAIAETDLKQRGAGDLLGSRQHGNAQFYCAKSSSDFKQAHNLVADWKQAPARQLFEA